MAAACFVLLLYWQHAPPAAVQPREQPESGLLAWRAGPAALRGDSEVRVAAVPITGHVRSVEGPPIAEAAVCVRETDETVFHLGRSQVCTRSDAQGRFTLEPPASPWLELGASAPGFEPGIFERTIDGRRASEVGIVLSLQPGGAELSGQVTDVLGGSVGGAQVRAVFGPPTALSATTVTADAEGRFSVFVGAGDYATLLASAPDYASAQSEWAAPAKGIKLILTPESSISGRVVLRGEGVPVAGVSVRARDARWPNQEREDAHAVSGDDGGFILHGVYPGPQQLIARSSRYFGELNTPLSVGLAEHVRDVVLEVDAAATLRGHAVIQSTGEACQPGRAVLTVPSSGPNVAYAPRVAAAVSDLRPDGSFELRGVRDGEYQLEVACKDHRATKEPLAIEVEGRDVEGLVYPFEAGKRVHVAVIDSKGAPISDVWISLQPVPASIRAPGWGGVTDAAGRFEFGGLSEGKYKASAVSLPGVEALDVLLAAEQAEASVTLRSAGDAEILVQVNTVDGSVDNMLEVSALRRPAGGESSSHPAEPHGGEEPHAHAPGELWHPEQFVGQPTGGGRFRIGGLEAGAYEVFVSDPRNPTVQAEGPAGRVVQLAAAQSIELVVELTDHSEVVRGKVVAADGGPASDVWVHVTHDAERATELSPEVRFVQGEKRVLTGDDGTFELTGLSRGAVYTVHAERADDGARAMVKDVRPAEPVVVQLPEPGRLRGTVVDENGEPVQRFEVAARSLETDARRGQEVVASDGRFALEGIVPGEVQVIARSAAGSFGRLLVTLAPNQTLSDLRIVIGQRLSPPQLPGATAPPQ